MRRDDDNNKKKEKMVQNTNRQAIVELNRLEK